MKDVVLIGMPGSGKTTVARLLAASLGRAAVDLDAEIEREMGMTVARCFELYGEAAFRVKETELMTRFAGSGIVLALGGGAVQNAPAMRMLEREGIFCYLQAPPAVLADRLRGDRARPLLAGGDPRARLERLYAERRALYERYADWIVDAARPPEAVAAEIARLASDD